MLVLFILLSGVISFLISIWLIKRTEKFGLIDTPNKRSSHELPTPKGGGIGIVLGIFVTLSGCFLIGRIGDIKYMVLIAGGLAIALLGLYGDRFKTSIISRLVIQSLIACTIIWVIGVPEYLEIGAHHLINLGGFGIIFAIIWLVGMTNFYNFMDGIDGLAAMQGIIAGIGITVFGILLQDNPLITIGLILSGATTGFLVLNVSPAKIFMGDVGSYFLGFFIASFVLIYTNLLIPIILMMGVFIFDTVVTLARRVFNGECWYRAHRNHFYQRATSLGHSHMQITFIISLISSLFLIMACIYLLASVFMQLIILAVALLILTTLAFWITIKEKKYKKITC